MRIATYNVAWFDSLFDDDDRLVEDDGIAGRGDVTRALQAAALGHVFTVLDADAVLVVEAPDEGPRRSTVAALENFAQRFGLRTRRAARGFASAGQQEIALLFDPDQMTVCHDPQGAPTGKRGAPGAPRFDGALRIDLDGDGVEEIVTFARAPLELLVETAGGIMFRMIGAHTKSKAPHGARTPEDLRRTAIANRRKQWAQCIWLRRRIEEHLSSGEPLVVLGDLNDGPELDEYEYLFPHSSVELVLGWGRPAELQLFDHHARLALGKRLAAAPTSARFLVSEEGAYFSALLDYIMVSPDLRKLGPQWHIWHPFDDPACYRDEALRDALVAASDHFPVTLDIEL